MKVTLKTKIIGVAVIPLAVAIFVSTFVAVSSMIAEGNARVEAFRERLVLDVKERLKSQTQIAVSTVKKYYAEGDSEEAQQKAMAMVKELRYGDKGYFWINDFYPNMIMHPFAPQLDGKSLREYKDPNGVFLFNEMVKVSQANGEGFVNYMWPKPGFDQPQPKISFVLAFKEWNWIIGTGVYVDDIDRMVAEEEAKVDEEINSTIMLEIIVGVILVLLISIISYVLTNKTIVRRIYDLVKGLEHVRDNADFSRRLPIEGNDEIAVAKQAFNGLVESIQISINDLSDILSALSNGDFSKTASHENKGDLEKLRKNTNRSIELLTGLIIDIKEAAVQVSSGSDELARSSQSLAAGSSEQAASVEEISSSMAELEGQTKNNSSNAGSASKLSQQMLQKVEAGNQQMSELAKSMQDINETSTDVSKIIKVIDEIAFQTNLLALNAAVEAARAGKYGKGFAVVAEEVRNLASRSAEAARNTTELIEASVKRVEEGVVKTDKTAEVLKEISENAGKVNDLVSEIAASSVEQTDGINEVNKGLNQINKVVQQNASISEEAASASEQLSSLSTQLQDMMRKFKVNGSAEPVVKATPKPYKETKTGDFGVDYFEQQPPQLEQDKKQKQITL